MCVFKDNVNSITFKHFIQKQIVTKRIQVKLRWRLGLDTWPLFLYNNVNSDRYA